MFVGEDFVNRFSLYGIYDPVTPSNRNSWDQIKLFLDTHNRFYLVVCELTCKAPGCPSVSREKVCESGFVVRRYTTRTSLEGRDALNRLLWEKNRTLFMIQKLLPKQAKKAKSTKFDHPFEFVKQVGEQVKSKKLDLLTKSLDNSLKELKTVGQKYDVQEVLQKWAPDEKIATVGAWTDIDDPADVRPQIIDETVHPLYPLIPDPDDDEHSARGKNLWFGVVPTFSSDVDGNGYARFDSDSAYEIRCFVRQHDLRCPKTNARSDCRGSIIWSEASEIYRLAPAMDLDGTGHRPVNIQLPDLNALKEHAERGPAGKGANVRMISPTGSALSFVSKGMDMPDQTAPSAGAQICFFSIPLITIVALFVFKLFLPIVVWLFSLWFLLRLRFCIPPSFSFNVQLAADLKAFGPEFSANITAKINADLQIELGGHIYTSLNEVKNGIKSALDAQTEIPAFLKSGLKSQVDADFDASVDLITTLGTDFSDHPEAEPLAGAIPMPRDGLIYFNKVPLE